MEDQVVCCDCRKPIEYEEAEMAEDARGFGPLLVCSDCYDKRSSYASRQSLNRAMNIVRGDYVDPLD